MSITCTNRIPHHKFKDWKEILLFHKGILIRNYYQTGAHNVDVEYRFDDSESYNEFEYAAERLIRLNVVEKRSDTTINKILRRIKLFFRLK